MAKKPQVDVRKLKDDVAESLKKQKWDRAADVLEQLILAEPKDMSHRLKLGDAYRHIDQPAKAIAAYQHAASFFAEEGQLIKAIGAVKIILEIDPRNAEAQARLSQMNQQRIGGGKAALGKVGLKKVAAPRPEPVEDPAPQDTPGEIELAAADEDEPLELDDGKPSRAAPKLPKRGFDPTPKRAIVPPASKDEDEPMELEAAGEDEEILTPEPEDRLPEPEDLIAPDHDDAILPDDEDEPWPLDAAAASEEDEDMEPAAASIRLPKEVADAITAPLSKKKVAAAAEDEIVLEDEPGPAARSRPKTGPRPIADLLSGSAEEEVELLSISADEERGGERPSEADLVEDADLLDDAFDRVAGAASAPRKLPTKKVPLFDDLSQAAFVELVNKLSYHRHAPGEVIIHEGDPGRSFFIIVEGKVRIYKVGPDQREITLAHLGEGAFFGEMALLSGAPRTANVVAEEDTEILEVTDSVLREMAARHPQVVRSLKNFYRQRLLNNVMAISPLFKDFDPAERKSIVEKFRMKQAGGGEVLITEETDSDGLYVVLHGNVEVSKSGGDEPVLLAKLKEGDIFGEMSLLTRKPATATVTSLGNSILLRLPRESFQELVVTHPQILELVSELTERRRSATEAILQGNGEGHDGMSYV